jgi:hypothetical protein
VEKNNLSLDEKDAPHFCFFFNFWRSMINYARTAGKPKRSQQGYTLYSIQGAWSRRNIELVHKIARKSGK